MSNTIQATLVNPTPFEQELNKLAIAIKGNEFSLYTLVSHELNTSDETIVKETFNRIMVADNGFNPSTVARYFTDVKKLSVIASNYVTLTSYKKALKDLGIVNMNTANTWLTRESAITIAIRSVNLANRNDLLAKRNDIRNVGDVRLLLTAISEQATIDEKTNKEAAAAKVASEAAAAKVASEAAAAPTVTAAAPTVTAAAPTVTAAAPTVTAAAPTVTAAAPTVTAAAPTVTAAAPTVTAAAPTVTAAAPTVTAAAPTVTAPSKKAKVCTDEMFDAVLATMRIMTDLQLKNLQASLLAMTNQRKTGTK